MTKELAFERQNLADGSANPKYVDLLDEDKPVAGQKFTCISFVSPDNILKKKDLFFFEEFLKHWDYTTRRTEIYCISEFFIIQIQHEF